MPILWIDLREVVVFVSGMCLGGFLCARAHVLVSRRLWSER